MPTEYPGTPPEVPDPRDAASGASGASPDRADDDTPTTKYHRTGTPGATGPVPPATDDADWWAHAPKIEYPSDTTGLVDAPVGPTPALPLPGAPDVFPRVDPAALTADPESGSPTPGSGATAAESGPAEPGPASPPRSMSGAHGLRGAEPPRKPRGSVQRQKVGVTVPRDPSLGEARAREKGRERAAAAERLAEERLAIKRRNRKRVLIGGAAVAGVATLVGAGYLAYSAANKPNEVTAYCVTDDNNQQTVVPDDDCVKAQDYVTSYGGGGYYNGAYTPGIPGIFLYNGHQYRYYYGGSNTTIGSHPTGGSFSTPSHSVTSTKSGTVVRGGLGVKGGGKSGGS
ncbi:hypothetical protein [Nocardia sp. BMG111209]|uniref:hypothetical protein n=1 Tax=Nocardia sp. BMG111209 TaxID=1160137 RepID=UPI0003778A79|nr:hypothetical protein [Nocardia sp. BMG111209]